MCRSTRLVVFLLSVTVFGLLGIYPSGATEGPKVGLVTPDYPEGSFINADKESKPVLTGKLENEERSKSAVVYTLSPTQLPLGSRYRMIAADAMRSPELNSARWLAARHWQEGKQLKYWPELVAVQLCIWSFNSSFSLSQEQVPDAAVLMRAQDLCAAVKAAEAKATAASGLETPAVLRQIHLGVDVVKSTATHVTVEARLEDRDTNREMKNYPLHLTYDESEKLVETGPGGVVRLDYPRQDHKVLLRGRYEGEYGEGVPWASVDGRGPYLITGESLPQTYVAEKVIDPSTLTSGAELAYQLVSDFMAKHTPLPSRPGAVIGLIVLVGGWILGLAKLVEFILKLVEFISSRMRHRGQRRPETRSP